MTTLTTQAPIHQRGVWLFFAGFALYSAVVLSLAAAGVFAALDTNVFPAVVALATIGLTASYFLIPSVRAFALWLGPYGLAYFHVWRIAAALTFLYYGSVGMLPPVFVNLAGWGDMLAGVLAAVVLLMPKAARTITAFHVIGLADFVIAVATGIVLNAVDPASMANVVLLPIAMIPLVGVPLSGATHIAALHMLRTAKAAQI